nr:MAG TPA: hypothetical protein [Caudoviricetes sp.]
MIYSLFYKGVCDVSPLEQNRFMNQTGMYNKIQDHDLLSFL